VAEKLASEKGYIIEVQGYSRSGVANSQAMADSVVRYLVTEHQVPIYRTTARVLEIRRLRLQMERSHYGMAFV